MSNLAADTNIPVRKPRAGSATGRAAENKAVELRPIGLEAFDAKARKEILTMAGKEVAAQLGAAVLREVLEKSGKTMRQVARETGFDVSLLSNIANGKRKSGPELWTLIALADAQGIDLTLELSPR